MWRWGTNVDKDFTWEGEGREKTTSWVTVSQAAEGTRVLGAKRSSVLTKRQLA